MNKRSLSALLISALFLSGLTMNVYGQTGGSDRTVARVWLQHAADLISDDAVTDWPEIMQSIDIASQYSESGSDSMYLRGHLLLSGYPAASDKSSQSPVNDAVNLFASALEQSAGSDIISFSDKALAWLSAALRLGRYSEILRTYREWPAGHLNDPVLLYGSARAALYAGNTEYAAELALRGESLAEPGTDLSVLGPESFGAALPAFRAISVAAGDAASVETLDAASRWGESLDQALIPWVLSGYIETSSLPLDSFGEELNSIHRLLSGKSDVLPVNHSSDLALMRRLSSAKVDLSTYTGTLVADSNYDGYVEEKVSLLNGRLQTRSIDSDQNGLYEWYITYEDGLPLQIITDDGRLTVNYRLGSYPEMLSMTHGADVSRIEIGFNIGAATWAPIANDVLWDVPRGRPVMDSSFWETAKKVVVTHDFPEEYATGKAITYLAGGYAILAREYRYANNSPAEPLWVRELLYHEGQVSAGRRSFRSEQSSRIWELYERYEAGQLVGLAWDPDMLGSPTYLADWALNRVLEVQVWDTDRDGWIDYRRFVLPDGRVSAKELLVSEAGTEDLLAWSAADWFPWEN